MSELLGSHIERHVEDGEHKIVLPNAILVDKHITRRRPEYYRRFEGTGSILLHCYDETYEGGYDRYRFFAGVLRWHWSSLFNDPSILVIPLGYREAPPSLELRLAGARRYVWSFSGEVNKSSRPDMLAALARLQPSFLVRSDKHADGTPIDRILGREEYYDVLCNSTFAPCPMGNVNIESFRLYESLECGAIPLVEKRPFLDYYRGLFGEHPIPTVRRWSEAACFIERAIREPSRLEALQRECLDWWRTFKTDLRRRAGEFLVDSTWRGSPRDVTPRLVGHAAWQYLELIKHHDLPSLARRIRRQAQRVVTDSAWRRRI